MPILEIINSPIIFIAAIIGFLLAITINKWSQGKFAIGQNDSTSKLAGRYSLNPFKHLDIWGTIYFLISGVGWGKPVPINPFNLKNPQVTPIKIIFVGFLSNIILALLISIPIRFFNFNILIPHTFVTEQIISFLQVIIEVNLLFIVFNLIPIPPLDGSKILFAFISQESQVTLEKIGPFILFALLIAAFFTKFNIFSLAIFPIIQYLNYLITAFPFS
jgi:Zn-dependent protease